MCYRMMGRELSRAFACHWFAIDRDRHSNDSDRFQTISIQAIQSVIISLSMPCDAKVMLAWCRQSSPGIGGKAIHLEANFLRPSRGPMWLPSPHPPHLFNLRANSLFLFLFLLAYPF